jgi:hypothetical protein
VGSGASPIAGSPWGERDVSSGALRKGSSQGAEDPPAAGPTGLAVLVLAGVVQLESVLELAFVDRAHDACDGDVVQWLHEGAPRSCFVTPVGVSHRLVRWRSPCARNGSTRAWTQRGGFLDAGGRRTSSCLPVGSKFRPRRSVIVEVYRTIHEE